jgi:hypothetical protein
MSCAGSPPGAGSQPESTGAAGLAQEGDTLAAGEIVDAIRVGSAMDCLGPDCAERLSLAKDAAIKRHSLTPAALGPASFYQPYLPPGGGYGSGGGMSVVFDLQDGSRAAVETFCFDTCFVVDPQPVAPVALPTVEDHGPLVDPVVASPIDCASAKLPMCNEAVAVAIETATSDGLIKAATISDTHYYTRPVDPGSPEAEAGADYVVTVYGAGDHEVVEERAIPVSCASGRCVALSLP